MRYTRGLIMFARAAGDPSPARFSWQVNVLLACAMAVTGLAAAFVAAQVRGGFDIEFFRDASPLPRIVQGFGRPSDFQDETGAAVREQGYLRLRRLNRAVPWRAELLARSSSTTRSSDLIVTVDDTETLRQRLSSEWTLLTFDIPAASRPGVVLGFQPVAERSRRTTPAIVGEVALRSSSWTRLNAGTVFATLFSCLAIGLLVASAGWDIRSAVVGLVAVLVVALVLTRGLATEGRYSEWATWWTALTAFLGAGSIVALRRSSARWSDWRAGIVLGAATTAVHGVILGHPLMGIGDSLFHLHRFQAVDDGQYLMTSEAPGGEFPYPIAFYVIAKAITRLDPLVEDTQWMLRALAVIAHAGAGLAVFGLVRRWRSAEQAFWAQLMFLVVPVGFHTQGFAYLTNSFGQSLSVIALCVAGGWAFERRRWLGAALLTVATAVAFLSHLGSFMLLGVSLAILAGLYVITLGTRPRGTVVAFSTMCAGLLSVLLFYAWFGDTYRTLMTRPASSPEAAASSPQDSPPVMRREAHQTQYVPGLVALRVRLDAVPRYVNRYFGWWLLPLAVIGSVAAWSRRTDALSLLVVVWIATGAAFFTLGHVSSIDLRYYLGTYPALAILASEALSSTSLWSVWAGRVLVAVGTASGIIYWLQWLGHWP